MTLSLVPEETINNVVDTWSLTTHVDETDLHGTVWVHLQQGVIDNIALIAILVCHIGDEFVLHLDEVVACSMVPQVWQLFINQLFGVFRSREILLDSGDGDLSLFQLVWNGGDILDS